MARGQLVGRRPQAVHRDPDRRLSRRTRERRRAGGGGAASRGSRSWRSAPATPTATTSPAGQQRAGVDLRPERRAGADLRPHRPGHRRGRARPARVVMNRARPSPIRPGSPPAPPRPASGRANLRQAYDLALAGGLGALFGLYLYVELVQAESVYVRDALAGHLIGGSLGVFLNAYGPLRDGAWLKLARAVAWGAPAAALGGAIGLVAGRGRDRPLARRAARPGPLVGGARPGDRPGPGAGRSVARAPDLSA